MPHVVQQVFFMAASVGDMLQHPDQLPPGVETKDLTSFLRSVITEHESSYDLRHANLTAVRKEISDFFDGHMTSEKNKLVAEESAEAAADIVASAAVIAAAAGEWIPGVNFALNAVAAAALIAQQGLEFAVKDLEGTIVDELSTADTIISQKPAFAKVKPYSEAVSANTHFIPRLRLGARSRDIRAMFLSLVIVVKKENKGQVTVDHLKSKFIDIYHASNDAVIGPIIQDYLRILSDLDDRLSVSAKPPSSEELAARFRAVLKTVPPLAKRLVASIMLMFTVSLAVRHGKKAYSAYSGAVEAVATEEIEMDVLDENGQVLERGGTEGGAEGAIAVEEELSVMSKLEIGIRGIGVLAGVAVLVFAGLEIKVAVETERKLSQAIADSKAAMLEYYEDLVGAHQISPSSGLPSSFPKPPFQERVLAVQGNTGEEWSSSMLKQRGWAPYAVGGNFNVTEQCMEAEPEFGHLWGVILTGPLSNVDTMSYVCVGGPGAQYVDVAIYPPTSGHSVIKYQGWNGTSFIDGPAVSVKGYYWYRMRVRWFSPFPENATTGTLYAKAYRKLDNNLPGQFKLWAFHGQ